MSISAGLALMKKLGAKVASISVQGLPLNTIKSALRSEATSVSIYALKIDSGDKQGWLVNQPITGSNPLIVDPNYPSYTDDHYKGCFDTLQHLQNRYSPSELNNDDYAFVLSEVPCMQDLVSNAFLKNKGTGTFTTGSIVSSTEDYLILDYLESTGTQYIDTGIKFQANDRIEIEVTPLATGNSIICGAYENSTKICTLGTGSFNTDSVFCGNASQPAAIPIYTTGTRYTLINNSGQWSYNSTNFGTLLNNTVNYTNTLFARNSQQVDNYSRCRIHSYKHIRNGQVIMNLRPVNRLTDLIRWKWNSSTSSWVKENYVLEEAITFTSQSAAQTYINNNNLHYEYPDFTTSTISPIIIEGYIPETPPHTPDNVDLMSDELGPKCFNKNNQCWSQTPRRPGTPIEFTQVIKEKIFSYG